MTTKLLAAMNAAGMKVNPDTVREITFKLTGKFPGLLPDVLKLWQEMEDMTPPEPRKRIPRRLKRVWKKATKKPLSNAAQGSLHDRIRAPHRPSGKMLPRPRWSLDEEPMGGWDLGEVPIEPGMEARLDAILAIGAKAPKPRGNMAARLNAIIRADEVEEEQEPGEQPIEARLELVLAQMADAPEPRRRRRKATPVEQKPERPVVRCRRVLPWVRTRKPVKAVLRCSRCSD
jgi:hypothetical protein